jgi:hypothetical protein
MTSFREKTIMNRLVLSALTLAIAATPALAISRYNTTQMQCAAIQSKLAREGAAILRYPSKNVAGLTLYDRYVRDSGYCDYPREYAKRVTVPARDTSACPVRLCKERQRLFRFPFNRDN